MGWKVIDVMDQRERFVIRAVVPGANLSALCAEFGISRKTGYKWVGRFRQGGVMGLSDLSRRPRRMPSQVDAQDVVSIVSCRLSHPTWGAGKIKVALQRGGRAPSERTITRILQSVGLIHPTKRRRPRRLGVSRPEGLVQPRQPNDLWTVDFKGWWRTTNRKRCEPVTVRDAVSRMVLQARLVGSTAAQEIQPIFDELFCTYGLPLAIRSDNGSPFASTRAPAGLTKLSARWLALGIRLERIEPGKPHQNGGHERMHLDLAREVQSTPCPDPKRQQEALDQWRTVFNTVRPHGALEMKTPSDLYRASPRRYDGTTPTIEYPEPYEVRQVGSNGTIKFRRRRRFVSEALAGWPVGLTQQDDVLQVWFCNTLLGRTDTAFTGPLKPAGQS